MRKIFIFAIIEALLLFGCGGNEDCFVCGEYLECRDMTTEERREYDFVRDCHGLDTEREPIVIIMDMKNIRLQGWWRGDFICMPPDTSDQCIYYGLFRHELIHFFFQTSDHPARLFHENPCEMITFQYCEEIGLPIKF